MHSSRCQRQKLRCIPLTLTKSYNNVNQNAVRHATLGAHLRKLCELHYDQATAGKGPAKRSRRARKAAVQAPSPKPAGKANKTRKGAKGTAAKAQHGALRTPPATHCLSRRSRHELQPAETSCAHSQKCISTKSNVL